MFYLIQTSNLIIIFSKIKILNFLDGGISIPTSYTSFLAPLQSAKLYSSVRDGQASEEHGSLYYGDRSTASFVFEDYINELINFREYVRKLFLFSSL